MESKATSLSSLEELPKYFRPFTRDSLQKIYLKIEEEKIKNCEVFNKDEFKRRKERHDGDDGEGPQPNPKLEQGVSLPIRLAHNFREEFANIPLEDFDSFYASVPSFVIVTKKQDIFRFSATDAMYCLSPFNPVRRVAIAILTHGLFSLTIITTILLNCYVMIMPSSPFTESTEVVFTAIYTFESAVKVFARGFILEKFTYLRDAWNWLDFVVIALAYITMGIDLGNLAALRTCRVFRALKTVAIVPGLKTIVGAVIESVKNLRDVIILTVFALSVFGLVGLQIYMGVLTQKCIRDYPEDFIEEGKDRDANWEAWNLNFTNWFPYPPPEEYGASDYFLCGNSSGAGMCPENYTCFQGYGPNPNYGYTSFDTFGNAFLSAFRLMTQDFWESLYQQILRSAGPWHMLFFIVIIFLGSYYLVNLILAIVAMSYDELEKKAEEDANLDAAEKVAIREEEERRALKIEAMNKAAKKAREKAFLQRKKRQANQDASIFSKSFESLADQQEEKVSNTGSFRIVPGIRVEASNSLPGTPSISRRGSLAKRRDRVMLLSSYLDAQGNLQYADDSDSPSSEGNGLVVLSFCNGIHPTNSFNSHDSRTSYTSHTDEPVTKESKLIQKAKTLYGLDLAGGLPGSRKGSDDPSLDFKEFSMIHEIIDQAAGPPQGPIQGERLTLKEKIKNFIFLGSMKCLDFFCLWDCGYPWSYFKFWVAFIIFDAFTELFITLAIVVNTVFMALDHYGLEEKPVMNAMLANGNTCFTVIFTLESSMKIIAMSPKYFFQVGWNVFDFVIVAFSLIEVVFEDANLPGLSALRSFRLLRVFKLAKSWPALNMILTIMGQTVGALSNLVFVLVIIIFIFAVMGMQLFAPNYYDKKHLFPGGEMPRWNFTDFGHSFLIVFRVLCGEWIESMWDCMLVTGGACIPFFLATVVVGNLVLLNLFLALLLSSFGASSLAPSTDNEPNKLAEAFDRFGRFFRWIKAGVRKGIKQVGNAIDRAKRRINPSAYPPTPEPQKRKKFKTTARLLINTTKLMSTLKTAKEKQEEHETSSVKSYGSHSYPKKSSMSVSDADTETESEYTSDLTWSDSEIDEKGSTANKEQMPVGDEEVTYPADCMPPSFYQRFNLFAVDDTPFGIAWANLRLKTYRLIEDKYFETIVIIMILLSSAAMAFEDIHLQNNPILVDALFYIDRVFTIIFFFEMLMKWLALGFVAYFTNAWCWLDFVIVMVSLINFVAAMAGYGSVQAFKTLKTLRALRPLRAMSRMQGMRIVVNALIGAIPAIFNVLLVCLIFWLIFAIMGVQLFNGKFHKCLDDDGNRPDYRIIRNKEECLANNFTWENSVMNFDHVGKAYLCLFQVATFKGWIGIMNDAIDSREIDEQPHREVSFAMYGYFVVFIIFGSFFTLNLFIGVIIDNFNEQKKKSGGSMEMFMTEDQKAYYAAMQKMGNKKPIKATPKPRWKPQLLVFNFVINQTFDMVIMLFIGLNMILMMLDHYKMNQEWDTVLGAINSVFVAIFTAECVLKVFALRQHYFTEPWNLFDLVVVFMSVAGMMLSDLIEKYFVSPTLLRVVRVAKVGRVLRLVKGAKGIRTLLFALAMSLPALFNICLLLFLVMFIFSIFGMGFFMNVKLRGALDEVYNFRTFGQSIILLFQMSTSAGWDGVLSGIMDEDDCEEPDPEQGNPGDCGNKTVAIAFLLSYLVMTFLIIINMYVAVILENYSQATEDVQEGLTDDDYEMYYEIYAQFDPDGTQYVDLSDLGDLIDALEPPLQIARPNKFKIVQMDIPICKGEMVYCVDVLDALTKAFFARKGKVLEEAAVEVAEVTVQVGREGYEVVSSTLWRQREEYCARMIQKMWRIYKAKKRGNGERKAGMEVEHGNSNGDVESDGSYINSEFVLDEVVVDRKKK